MGGKFILCCNFDVKRLQIKLSSFYEDCLKSFEKCSVANNQCEEITDDINETLQIILCNNKFLCIEGKLIFYNPFLDLISEKKK